MVGPTKLSSILIQRLDTMLGTNVGQQSIVSPADSPKVVYQPGSPDNLTGLKNPPEQELTNKDIDQARHRQPDKAAVGKALRQMDLDNLFGRQTTLKTATRSAPTTLGYTARIILALFNKYPGSNRTIQGQNPLLSNTDQAKISNMQGQPGGSTVAQSAASSQNSIAGTLAQNLAQSIENSGLFYESHLAKLAKGEVQVKDLNQQPQNRLGLKPSQGNFNIAGKNININLPTALNNLLVAYQQQTEKVSHQDATHTKPEPQSSTSLPANEQLQNIVRQQLEVLANQSFIWKGEAWTGAEVECEIRRETEDQNNEPSTKDINNETELWSSKLNLKLPKLGTININLNLQSSKLNIHIVAPQSGDHLRQSGQVLFKQLSARGLQTQQLSISNNDAAAGASTETGEINGPAE